MRPLYYFFETLGTKQSMMQLHIPELTPHPHQSKNIRSHNYSCFIRNQSFKNL